MKKIFSLILSLIFVLLNSIKVNAAGYGNPIASYPDLVDEFIKLENGLLNRYYGEQPVMYHRPPSESPFEFDEYRDIYLVNIPYLLQDNCGFVRAYTDAIEATLESLPLLQQAENEFAGKAKENLNLILERVYEHAKENYKYNGLTDFFNDRESQDDKEKVKKAVVKGMIINVCDLLTSNLFLKYFSGLLLAIGSLVAILKLASNPIAKAAAGAIGLGGIYLTASGKFGLEGKLSAEKALNYASLLNDFASQLLTRKEEIMNSNSMVMAVDARKFTSLNPLNVNRENQGHWLSFGNLKHLNSNISPMARYCTTNGGINKLIKKIEDTLNGKTVDLELIKYKIESAKKDHELLPKKRLFVQ